MGSVAKEIKEPITEMKEANLTISEGAKDTKPSVADINKESDVKEKETDQPVESAAGEIKEHILSNDKKEADVKEKEADQHFESAAKEPITEMKEANLTASEDTQDTKPSLD